MKSYFKAVHSTGTVHLRASQAGRPYAWAEVGSKLNCVAFASKRPGKLSKYAPADAEIVPAEEITVTEYNLLLKANKVGCSVVFRGKKYSHTDNIQQDRTVCALCLHFPHHENKVPLAPRDESQDWSVQCWTEHPEGYWVNVSKEHVSVWFFSSKEEAQKVAQRYESMDAAYQTPDVVEVLDVLQD
jgi:hypothetical protein